ncbi:hypothetical protein DMUE_1616 [Dictyocoela muelleri]|nr:hypothetical protein DMUE_1616 [Dictyocoela muelleri]
MEKFTIKRRIKQKENFLLYESLMILSSLKTWHPHIGDPLSLCLRICILNDLYFSGSITYNETITAVATDDFILNEALCKINNKNLTVDNAIRRINGEIGMGIKNLRCRVLDKLKGKNILKYTKKIFGFKIKVKKDILEQYSRDLLDYLLSSNEDAKYDVLVCCLDYVGVINKIIQTEKEREFVKNKISNIIKNVYRKGDFPSKTIQNLYQ